MNIDRSLVARAFIRAGEEPITQDEWQDGTSNRVRIVKETYHAMLLDSLASYDWTSQKKRTRLELLYEEVEVPEEQDKLQYFVLDENGKYVKAYTWDAVNKTYTPAWDPTLTYYVVNNEDNLTGFTFMYPIPADCAKVVQVGENKPYIVEGAFIFTDEPDAVLLYIRNYFTGKYVFVEVEDPVETDIDKYYVKNAEGGYEPAESWDPTETYYEIEEQDYNFYADPQLDPTLSSYFECRLAATIALKLTGDTDKYNMLYNEAQLIANNAMKKSAEQAKNKTHGNPWWTDQLGME